LRSKESAGEYDISAPGDYFTKAIHCYNAVGYKSTFAVNVQGSGWITFSAQNETTFVTGKDNDHIYAGKI
jgi:hypothetical protein